MMTARLNSRDLDRSVAVEIFPIDNSAFSKEDACTRHKTPSTSKAAKIKSTFDMEVRLYAAAHFCGGREA